MRTTGAMLLAWQKWLFCVSPVSIPFRGFFVADEGVIYPRHSRGFTNDATGM
jgi:hypothetical protein